MLGAGCGKPGEILAALLWMTIGAAALSAQPTIQIMSPVNGASVTAGQKIAVKLVVSPPNSLRTIGLAGTNDIGFWPASTAPPFQFSFTIPVFALSGEAVLTAIGATSPGHLIFSAPVKIVVAPSPIPIGLIGEPSILQLALRETGRLRAMGWLRSGRQVDLTQSPETTFSTSGTVATVSRDGVVTPIAPGIDTITIAYGGLSASVRIEVIALRVQPQMASLYPSERMQFLTQPSSRALLSIA
jgi:hypothetical protein